MAKKQPYRRYEFLVDPMDGEGRSLIRNLKRETNMSRVIRDVLLDHYRPTPPLERVVVDQHTRIATLERDTARLVAENAALKQQVIALQQLVKKTAAGSRGYRQGVLQQLAALPSNGKG